MNAIQLVLIMCIFIILGINSVTAQPEVPALQIFPPTIHDNNLLEIPTGKLPDQFIVSSDNHPKKDNPLGIYSNTSPQTDGESGTDQILIRYNTSIISASSVLDMPGIEMVREYSSMGVPGLMLLRVPASEVSRAILTYSDMPGVMYAEPDYIWAINRAPNDPEFWRQWGFSNTGQVYWDGKPAGSSGADGKVTGAWDISTGSKDVVVAVLDTGVDYTHPDLSGNMWTGSSGEHGYDVVNQDADPMDDNGHGTHCAGIIGAVGNNGVGMAGVSWQTTIMAVKVLGSDGKGRVSDVIEGIEYAAGSGADVISCSFGGDQYSQAAYDAIAASPALMVCAAGNMGNNNDLTPVYPASYKLSTIIGVAATTAQDTLAGYSNYGTSVHVAAPGDQIFSTYLTYGAADTIAGQGEENVDAVSTLQNAKYAYISGSSQATALVAGMSTLLKSIDKTLTPNQIRNLLITYSDPIIGLSKKVAANGRVNIHAAALSLSSQDNIPLQTGWNFVSVPRPLASGSDTAAIFAKVSSDGHSLLKFEDGGWKAMKSTDTISIMTGYWVYSTKKDSIPITFYPNPGVISRKISTGWNTYSLAYQSSKTVKDALTEISSIWKYLVGYDATVQQYEEPIVNGGTGGQSDDRTIQPFRGYWLYSSGEGILHG